MKKILLKIKFSNSILSFFKNKQSVHIIFKNNLRLLVYSSSHFTVYLLLLLHNLSCMSSISPVSNSECARCHRRFSEYTGSLKRCSKCHLRFYCSPECQRAHWGLHKVECELAHGAAKALQHTGRELDLHNPFEAKVAAFEAQPFNEHSFLGSIDTFRTFLIDATTEGIHRDLLSETTYLGCMRLNALALKGLNQFPDNTDISELCLQAILAYIDHIKASTASAMSGASDVIFAPRLEILFNAGALQLVVNSIRMHIANTTVAFFGWNILTGLASANWRKHLESVANAGLTDLAHLTFRVHGRDALICHSVLATLNAFSLQVHLKKLIVPQLCDQPLTLAILLAARRYSSFNGIQQYGCSFLCRMLIIYEKDPSYVSMLVRLGAFDAAVTAIQTFPEDWTVVGPAADVLIALCVEYFADSSKPRNTSATLALVSTLPYFYSEAGKYMDFIEAIMDAIVEINYVSSASTKEFIHRGKGLSILAVVLGKCADSELIIGKACVAIGNSTYEAKQWDKLCPEYRQYHAALETELEPVLIQCLQTHKNSIIEELVTAIAVALIDVTRNYFEGGMDGACFSIVRPLIEEVLREHPSWKVLQERGGEFLRYIGQPAL